MATKGIRVYRVILGLHRKYCPKMENQIENEMETRGNVGIL